MILLLSQSQYLYFSYSYIVISMHPSQRYAELKKRLKHLKENFPLKQKMIRRIQNDVDHYEKKYKLVL